MQRRTALAVGVVVVASWWYLHDPAGDDGAPAATVVHRVTGEPEPARRAEVQPLRHSAGRIAMPVRRDDAVLISGTVVDQATTTGVGGVEVVFRGATGEESVLAGSDGAYRIELARGTYRAFVRDDSVLSVGRAGRVRLPSAPEADEVGLPDEGAMPVVVAVRDTDHVDLAVRRGSTIAGHVHDAAGRPIAGAIVRATGEIRPVLGTDVVETDAGGAFALRVPVGRWQLEASHPDFAGAASAPPLYVEPGEPVEQDLELVSGCVISGRVITADGRATGEGAVERKWGDTDHDFSPDGKIAADGTFRWVTTDAGDFTLRAWPWKSPPSSPQTFRCSDGARFPDVVFRLPPRGPDVEGTLADADGNPMPFAYVDLTPLDEGGIAQQERTDENGRWAVYQLPAGRYSVMAYLPGRGGLVRTITAPQTGVDLRLGGTGRLDGEVAEPQSGSFELQIAGCSFGDRFAAIADDVRIVSVVDGRFSVDGLPACSLVAIARWNGNQQRIAVAITAGGTATTRLAFAGEPRGVDEPDAPDGDDDDDGDDEDDDDAAVPGAVY